MQEPKPSDNSTRRELSDDVLARLDFLSCLLPGLEKQRQTYHLTDAELKKGHDTDTRVSYIGVSKEPRVWDRYLLRVDPRDPNIRYYMN